MSVALERRWQRFDVEYRLPSDLPSSVKTRDGKVVYTARAYITVVPSDTRHHAPALRSTSTDCWSPEVRFAVDGKDIERLSSTNIRVNCQATCYTWDVIDGGCIAVFMRRRSSHINAHETVPHGGMSYGQITAAFINFSLHLRPIHITRSNGPL